MRRLPIFLSLAASAIAVLAVSAPSAYAGASAPASSSACSNACNPAPATATIGQLPPAAPTLNFNTSCTPNYDVAEPDVSSGPTYAVPAGAKYITSWSTYAATNATQVAELKIFRPLDAYDPIHHTQTYLDYSNTLLKPLTPGVVNTFPFFVAVQPGDLIGFHVPNQGQPLMCSFSVPPVSDEDIPISQQGDLALGDSAVFDRTNGAGLRLNLSATVSFEPFEIAKAAIRPGNGIATITVDVPAAGTLALTGKGVRPQRPAREATASKVVSAAGTATLTVRPKGALKRKLRKRGKAKAKVTITYSPTGGSPTSLSKKLKLVEKKTKKQKNG